MAHGAGERVFEISWPWSFRVALPLTVGAPVRITALSSCHGLRRAGHIVRGTDWPETTYSIGIRYGSLFAFAGLGEHWKDAHDVEAPGVQSCTILTTHANAEVRAIDVPTPDRLTPHPRDGTTPMERHIFGRRR